MIADTPEKIAGYHLLTFKVMLKLESLGMKHWQQDTRQESVAR
jgi:hypothetical protein